MEARSYDAALHHFLSWSIALTQAEGVWGHCPVEKQMWEACGRLLKRLTHVKKSKGNATKYKLK